MHPGIAPVIAGGKRPRSLTYCAGGRQTSTAGGTSFNFNFDFGPPASGKVAIVACVFRVGSSSLQGINAGTFGGNAGTLLVTTHTGSAFPPESCIIACMPPAGFGGVQTVNLTAISAVPQLGVDAWYGDNWPNITPFATFGQNLNPASTNINVRGPDGVIIACVAGDDSSPTFTWTGATEVSDGPISSRSYSAAAASGLAAETGRLVQAIASGGGSNKAFSVVSF